MRFSPLRRSVTIPWGEVTITSSRLWVNPAVRHLDRKGIKLSCLRAKTRLSNPNGIKNAAARNTQIASYLENVAGTGNFTCIEIDEFHGRELKEINIRLILV